MASPFGDTEVDEERSPFGDAPADSESGLGGKVTAAAKGFNVGLSDVLTAPGDLLNKGINLLLPEQYELGMPSEIARRRGSQVGLTYQDTSQLPPDQRAIARGGEIAGQGIGMVAPLGAVAAGPRVASQVTGQVTRQRGPGIVNDVLQKFGKNPTVTRQTVRPQGSLGTPGEIGRNLVTTMREKPIVAGVSELAGATGAGVGAGLANTEEGKRLGAEYGLTPEQTEMALSAAGGVAPFMALLSPTMLVARTAAKAGNSKAAQSLRMALGPDGPKRQAAKIVQDLIGGADESGSQIISRLMDDEWMQGAMTSGQKAGSPILVALERQLASKSNNLGGKISNSVANTYRRVEAALLTAMKDPDSKVAEQAKIAYTRMSDEIIGGLTEQARRESGEAARQSLERARDVARGVEKQLWDDTPNNIQISGQELINGLYNGLSRARGNMLQEERLKIPRELLDAYDGFIREGTANTGQLKQLRSRLLEVERDALKSQAENAPAAARQARSLADGITGLMDNAAPQFRTATDYSRRYNQLFSERFVSDVLDQTARRQDVNAPSSTLERAGKGFQREENIRQGQQATEFVSGVGEAAPTQQYAKAVVQDGLASAIGEGGEINARGIVRFLNSPEFANARRVGALNGTQEANMRKVASLTARMEKALKEGKQIDEVIDNPDALTDLLASYIGARAAGEGFMAQSMGSSLVLAQKGSNMVRNAIGKMPRAKVSKLLEDAVFEPKLMIELIRYKGGSTWPVAEKQRSYLRGWLLQNGIDVDALEKEAKQ